MAGWISSKLKVAETLLQQIDQQAAESLRKGDQKHHSESVDALDGVVSSPKTIPPLRDQLLYKINNNSKSISVPNPPNPNPNPNPSPSPSPKPIPKSISRNDNVSDIKTTSYSSSGSGGVGVGVGVGLGDSDAKPKDIDWTELLNTPKPKQSHPPVTTTKINRPNKPVIPISNRKLVRKVDKPTPPIVVDAGAQLKSESESNYGVPNSIIGNGNAAPSLDSDISVIKVDSSSEQVSRAVSDLGKTPVVGEGNIAHADNGGGGGISTLSHNGDVAKDVFGGLKSLSHSGSDHDSDSDSGSSSSSESGDEREREERRQRRRQILAAKAAAKAADTIKEQENVVARLEGEKQSLQKILEDQANQAALEASELQSMMMEMMEATELEKQKHNHTRMKVLERMAKLETANADLAKSLATAQWNLEIEVNHLAELRQQVDVKQVVLEELRRKINGSHQTRATLTHLMASKGFELQKEMLEAECAFETDKIARLQEKGMKLEESIDMTLKEMENPTEVEVELRRRLRQMTDHLIQKQAMVESLSSDKATLLFRIEAVSRLLDENKSLTNGDDISGCSREDIESATWESTGSKLRPMLENKIESGRQHLGSLVRQLDAIFSAGAVFLARNPAAKLWSLVYLVSLHLWVLYILFSHSQSTEDSTSSSVVSLENINGSIGV